MWKRRKKKPQRHKGHKEAFCSLCLCGFFFLLFSSAAFAQKMPERIEAEPPVKKPVRPATGSLMLTSDPPGASVYINDELQSVTEADGRLNKPIILKPGRYRLVLKYPDYEVFQKEISIRAGESLDTKESLTPKYGFLVLSVADMNPDARIELDGEPVAEGELTRDPDNNIRIRTTPGEHTVSIAQTGYIRVTKSVPVSVKESAPVLLVLTREQATLIVRSRQGARIYINGEDSGSIVPTTGSLNITKLVPGKQYKILVELGGYERHEATVSLEPGKELLLEAELRPLPTSVDFFESFLSLDLWDAPKDWRVERGLLYVIGPPGVGLPKDKLYRDCEIRFDLSFVETRGAAWVIHAGDKKNYYLFYLGGPTGQYRNQLRSYICRDGKYDFNKPAASPSPIFIQLNRGEDYLVRIRVVGNLIEHYIIPSSTGKEIPIGVFKDQDNTFSFGNIGFAIVDGEEFKINGFSIVPLP